MPHSQAKGEAAAREIVRATGNHRIAVIEIDLSSFGGIRSSVRRLQHACGVQRINTLVCNAGIGAIPPGVNQVSPEGFNQFIQVNVLGNFLLVSLTLPMLRAISGRVVIIASGLKPDGACSALKLPAKNCTDLTALPFTV